MSLRTIACLAGLLLVACVRAGGPAGNPGEQTPPPATAKNTATATAPAADPAPMVILKRLEAAGAKYPNLSATMDYVVDMLQAGYRESCAGTVYYQSGTEKEPAKFRIHFDNLQQDDGPRFKNVVDYVFDGSWLTVRKERTKQFIRYQVAPPGENVNALQLGKGPFPVPFGQKAETVLDFFEVSTRKPEKTDPPQTDYIKLVTRQRQQAEMSVKWIELWVRPDGLPVRIVTEDRSENLTTVVFDKIKTPKEFPKATFDLPTPLAALGWEVRIETFTGQVK